MALSLRASVEIDAPPEHVFGLVVTPERLPEWNVSVEHARRITLAEPVCLGARAVFNGRVLGQAVESETEVSEFEPPRLFATRAVRGPRLTTRFTLQPCERGTRVEVELSGEMVGGALGARLAKGFLRQELQRSLARLQSIAEREFRSG